MNSDEFILEVASQLRCTSDVTLMAPKSGAGETWRMTMININEVLETNNMIEKENLDVRTITIGISLLECIDSDLDALNEKIYNRITTVAKNLVPTGQAIEREYGIPIVK